MFWKGLQLKFSAINFSARQILGMNSQNVSDKRVQTPISSSNSCHHFPPDCSGFWPFGHQLIPPFYTTGISTMFPPPSPIPVAMPFYYPGAMPQFDGNMRVMQHSSNNNTVCVRPNNETGNNLMIQFSNQTVNQNVGLPVADSINDSIALKGMFFLFIRIAFIRFFFLKKNYRGNIISQQYIDTKSIQL